MRAIILHAIGAGKGRLHVSPHYCSNQVLGFDFNVGEDAETRLIEINSTPAVASALLPTFASEYVRVGIDPLFPPPPEQAIPCPAEGSPRFEFIASL